MKAKMTMFQKIPNFQDYQRIILEMLNVFVKSFGFQNVNEIEGSRAPPIRAHVDCTLQNKKFSLTNSLLDLQRLHVSKTHRLHNSLIDLATARKPLECNYEHFFLKSVSPLHIRLAR